MPSGPATPAKSQKVETVFIAKGIAIFLVVWVHAFFLYSVSFWPYVIQSLALVPMPIFFFLSGYLMSYHGGLERARDVRGMLSNKARRLLYPYITIAVFSFFLKILAARVALLQHPATPQSYLNLFIDPIHSHMPLLWYIYVVIMMFMMFPFLLRGLKKAHYIFLASLVLYFLPWPQIFSLRLLFDYLPFFSLGFLLGLKYNLDDFEFSKPKYLLPAAITLVGSLYLLIVIQAPLTGKILLLVAGFAGISTIQIISRIALTTSGNRILHSLGYYSMGIYLLHTMCSSPIRIAYGQIFHLPSLAFPISEVTVGIVGVVVPLLLEKYVLRKLSFSRKYILGIY